MSTNKAFSIFCKLKFLQICSSNYKNHKPFPSILGFQEKETILKVLSSTDLSLYKQMATDEFAKFVCLTNKHCIYVKSDFLLTKDGLWAELIKITVDGKEVSLVTHNQQLTTFYLLLSCNQDNISVVYLEPTYKQITKQSLEGDISNLNCRWSDLIEYYYQPFNKQLTNQVEYLINHSPNFLHNTSSSFSSSSFSSSPSITWSQGMEKSLVSLVTKDFETTLNKTKSLVSSISVSSNSDQKENLLKEDDSSYWKSSKGFHHFIELKIKSHVIIESLSLILDPNSSYYMPIIVTVFGGNSDHMAKIATIPSTVFQVDSCKEIKLLEKQNFHFEIIKINFDCDVEDYDEMERIDLMGIKLRKRENMILNYNFYDSLLVSKYNLLNTISPEDLYKKTIVLKRLMEIFDECISYIYPPWSLSPSSSSSSSSSFSHKILSSCDFAKNLSQSFNHLFPFLKQRQILINSILENSETSKECYKTITIDRHFISTENDKNDNNNNSNNNNRCYGDEESVFYQVFKSLSSHHKTSYFRLEEDSSYWWCCKFLREGISDQGGGFRDSLSNLSQELCPFPPSSRDSVFKMFVPTPNQHNSDTSHSRDTYIPNGSCSRKDLFQWIGCLMGAAFRTKDNISITLSTYFWKLLADYEVTWEDYADVDDKEVRDLKKMLKMSKNDYENYYGDIKTWSLVTSDGRVIELKENGVNLGVAYEDREEYVEKVKKEKMNEFKDQIDNIKSTFYEVVPQSAVLLLTTEELETRITGNPIIELEALKKNVTFNYENDKSQMEIFWKVVEGMTNEERSLLLKFTTGRRRLPASFNVAFRHEKDTLPTATTCSYCLELPKYSSFEMGNKMIKLAITSCLTIDTDTNYMAE